MGVWRYSFTVYYFQADLIWYDGTFKLLYMKSSILHTISVLFQKPYAGSASITEACLLMPAHPLIPSSPGKVSAKEIMQ